MRRSGLLTAFFALAAGITVAFGASAAQLQPQPRAHVYLLRGLLNVFSLGMDSLAEELKGRGVDAINQHRIGGTRRQTSQRKHDEGQGSECK